jgi:quercetin dioxygenase-like cupin family protein
MQLRGAPPSRRIGMLDYATPTTIVSAADARRRHVRAEDLAPCALAFIDCKKPGSHLKQNFSIIGAGVTQSADQVVNLAEPHGFQIGAAGMPGGITNNLHIHYTAEVFMVFEGDWVFRWGDQGRDGEIPGGALTIVSVPTWIFRGFSNTGTGAKPELVFTTLGGDDTGGIIWHPDIVTEAGTYGLYLTKDNMLVDTTAGAKKPADADLYPLISDADRASLRRYTVEEMRRRVVTASERVWSRRPFLCSVLPGHGVEVAPVIGYGLCEDRDATPPITNPHGFSMEWLRLLPGQTLPEHAIAEKSVLMVFRGTATATFNRGRDAVSEALAPKSTLSVPGGVWRELSGTGSEPAEILMITAGDHRKRVTWTGDLITAARRAGYAMDHNGYVAPLRLLPYAVRMAG